MRYNTIKYVVMVVAQRVFMSSDNSDLEFLFKKSAPTKSVTLTEF